MPYVQRISRDHAGCILFLIDQSGSMNEEFAGHPDQTKATALCDAINSLLSELVIRCIKDPSEGVRHYYDIGVIGYGESVGPALGGALADRNLVSIVDVANHPLRIDERTRIGDDVSSKAVRTPVWFDAKAWAGLR